MKTTTQLNNSDGQSLVLAADCARLLTERKLEDVKVFDVRNSLQITDCFIIATGLNPRHLRAGSEHLLRHLREHGTTRRAVEGTRDCGWMLIDLDSIVVHLFLAESRRFYDLEILWGDSPLVQWEQGAGGGAGAASYASAGLGGGKLASGGFHPEAVVRERIPADDEAFSGRLPADGS
jgi:ribosome-associated protein